MEIVRESGQPIAVSVVFAKIKTEDFSASRITVIRDLQLLVKLNFLIRRGKGRGIAYALSPRFNLIFPIDIGAYFKTEPDKRKINRHFNFGVFPLLREGIWDEKEIKRLRELNSIYGRNVKKLNSLALKKELERLTIELSWKSSQIEGNTYTLLETEYLLKEHREPKGHTREETKMILNHKSALDYVFSNPAKFKKISIRDIEDVHRLLVEGLAVEKNLRYFKELFMEQFVFAVKNYFG